MLRKLTLSLLFGLGGTLAVIAADEEKPGTGKFDKAKMFEKMDANGDGKISKEEFKKLTEQMMSRIKEKLGDKADKLEGVFDKMFEKLDADGDGKLTKEEFEKFQPLGQGGFDPSKLKELLKKKKIGGN